jgi:NAD(P)-dependent dehydrogenase (short-subunit alcohol dehydrogenase family)
MSERGLVRVRRGGDLPAAPLGVGVAAVTGGARGIGRAIAAAFLAEGARVAIGDLDVELAESTARELGERAMALPLDVTERTSVDAFVAATEEQLGPIGVYVNNAGIMPAGPFLSETEATAHRQVDINVHGVLHGMKAVLPRMLERRAGHIVNVASAAGKGGFPGVVTYCGTKHAVVGITEAARLEYLDSGVRFSIVMPGFVDTELTSGMEDPRMGRRVSPEQIADAVIEAVRTGRVDVYVPSHLGKLYRAGALMSRRMRDRLVRFSGSDHVLLDSDPAARAAYEQRIAAPPAAPALQSAAAEREEA